MRLSASLAVCLSPERNGLIAVPTTARQRTSKTSPPSHPKAGWLPLGWRPGQRQIEGLGWRGWRRPQPIWGGPAQITMDGVAHIPMAPWKSAREGGMGKRGARARTGTQEYSSSSRPRQCRGKSIVAHGKRHPPPPATNCPGCLVVVCCRRAGRIPPAHGAASRSDLRRWITFVTARSRSVSSFLPADEATTRCLPTTPYGGPRRYIQ